MPHVLRDQFARSFQCREDPSDSVSVCWDARSDGAVAILDIAVGGRDAQVMLSPDDAERLAEDLLQCAEKARASTARRVARGLNAGA